MKVKDLRQKTSEELKKMLAGKQEELLNLRFEIANRKLKDFSRVEKGRKMIARILTIVRERELQEGKGLSWLRQIPRSGTKQKSPGLEK